MLRQGSYSEGADDALKNAIDELEAMASFEEEDGTCDDKMDGISQCIEVIRNMRKEIYS